eukprot:COSAG06_NODE_3179_length_5724_cov_88.554489_5_plen_46_part_00
MGKTHKKPVLSKALMLRYLEGEGKPRTTILFFLLRPASYLLFASK